MQSGKNPSPTDTRTSPPDQAVRRDRSPLRSKRPAGECAHLGVYVHFPWCLEKCPYCDFLSVKVPGAGADLSRARRRIPHQAYADAVIRELHLRAAALEEDSGEPDFLVGSIFFGGGTPSLWEPAQLGRVVAAVRSTLPTAKNPEITVECNPTSVSEQHFAQLLEVGINRVSVGVQAIDTQRLRFLGRLHDEFDGLAALGAARAAGMPSISADLIFGVFRQAPAEAVQDVLATLDSGIDHLSAYALTIEENTRFGALHRDGRLPLLDEELVARSFEEVSAALKARGLVHYEVSNYARPGQESQHNLGYWLGHDYLGLGTGAYGTVTRRSGRLRYRNLLVPERYLDAYQKLEAGQHSPFEAFLTEREPLCPETSIQEAILLGLRTTAGIEPARIADRFGAPFWTPERQEKKAQLVSSGRLGEKHGRLWVPSDQWLWVDGIIRELI